MAKKTSSHRLLDLRRAGKALLVALVLGAVSPPATLHADGALTFTTLAGNAGYGSADGTGPNARFNFPAGVAVDAASNTYVADSQNCTIRKVAPTGATTTLAGSAGNLGAVDDSGASARFTYPQGIAVDNAGTVYVADTGNSTIRQITPAGVVTTLAGSAGTIGSSNGIGTSARFNLPAALAVDAAGTLYVADTDNSTIRMLTRLGTNWVVTTLAGTPNANANQDGTNANARFYQPTGIAVDTNRNLYVADTGNGLVRKITPVGTNWVTTTLATTSFPGGIAVDMGANLYVANSANNTLQVLRPSGTNWLAGALAGSAGVAGSADGTNTARFNYPRGVAVASNSLLSVADSLNNTIRQVTAAGVVSTLAGTAGGPGTNDGLQSQASFNAPLGLAVDAGGTIYVADSQNDIIRSVTPAGAVTTLAGQADGLPAADDGTGTNASFNLPAAMAVDAATNLYVADYFNNEIRKLNYAGSNWLVSTWAGRAGVGSGGPTNLDGIGTNALFYHPSGLAFDLAGNLCVADGGTNGVRVISPSAAVATLPASVGWYSVDPTLFGTNKLYYHSTALAIDLAGNIFVADAANGTLRKIARNGSVTTLAGSPGLYGIADGTNSAARFGSPVALALDAQTNLYVADQANHTLRKVQCLGTNWVVTTVGGVAQSAGSTDGAGTAARFNRPGGLAFDGSGALYLADTGNNTLRRGQSLTTAVALELRLLNGEVVVSWPVSADGFNLEATTNLSSPGGWSSVTNQPSSSGSEFYLTNLPTAPAVFYRLHRP
jgi:sugar lactone lactonase YvrE